MGRTIGTSSVGELVDDGLELLREVRFPRLEFSCQRLSDGSGIYTPTNAAAERLKAVVGSRNRVLSEVLGRIEAEGLYRPIRSCGQSGPVAYNRAPQPSRLLEPA